MPNPESESLKPNKTKTGLGGVECSGGRRNLCRSCCRVQGSGAIVFAVKGVTTRCACLLPLSMSDLAQATPKPPHGAHTSWDLGFKGSILYVAAMVSMSRRCKDNHAPPNPKPVNLEVYDHKPWALHDQPTGVRYPWVSNWVSALYNLNPIP